MINLPHFSKLNFSTYPQQLTVLLSTHRQQLDQLLASASHWSWDTLMRPLQEWDNDLACFWSPLAHLHAVMDTPALRTCYEACLPQLSAHESAISQNESLYHAINSLDRTTLNSAQQKIVHDTLRDFSLAGVSLAPQPKQRYETIHIRLSDLSNQFEQNILDAEAAFQLHQLDETQLAGLPAHTRATARLTAEKLNKPGWILTLSYPTYLAVMTYAEDRSLRQTLYHAYHTRASDLGPSAGQFDNTAILSEILTLRHEQAALLGFSHYTDYSLATKMLQSSSQVLHFLEDLVRRAKPQAEREYAALAEFAHTHHQLNTLEAWDIAYLSQQKKQHDHALNDEQLRAYFPLPRVMQGLFHLIQQLFNITLRAVTEPVDTWHPEVSCYALYDAQQQLRGYLYLDLFARANKRSGAWMDSLQSRMQQANGEIQLPIATLTCNFAPTATAAPPTLSHDEVITLLHEMGHCLHHLLTQVDYLSASGINGVEWDAVELPSQLLENWAWTPEGIALLSAHAVSGEALPEALLSQLLASKRFQSAMHLMRQLELALFDFRIHLLNPQAVTNLKQAINQTLTDIQQNTRVTPISPNERLAQCFGHIFAGGYAAGYYSYLWAEVLSSDAFARFSEEGLLNAATGQAFLQQILAVGSTRSAAESYLHFRGREANLTAFLHQHGIT